MKIFDRSKYRLAGLPRLAGLSRLGLAACLLLLAGCAGSRATPPDLALVDPGATAETKALYANLKRLASGAVLFGHQDDLAYGVTWKREKGRSDVKDVVGAYPAVFGWELGDLELGHEANLDGVNFKDMKGWIKEGYKAGSVVTIAWHLNNPVSGGNAWDTTRAVHTLLLGGANHATYKRWLDTFADFVGDLEVGAFRWLGLGTPIPVIFRPFHEHTGGWFWWGKGHASPDEYKQLWRFTVDYLRDEKGLHNLLYAYSPDHFTSEAEYLERYPGDAYVDIFGYDDYGSLRTDEGVARLTENLRTVVELAEARGKIAALTETGLEGVPDEDWWTNRLLAAIEGDPVARRIVYALVWRNANEADKPGHHYAPYTGHPSAPNFVRFYEHPFVLFADELPDLYRYR